MNFLYDFLEKDIKHCLTQKVEQWVFVNVWFMYPIAKIIRVATGACIKDGEHVCEKDAWVWLTLTATAP